VVENFEIPQSDNSGIKNGIDKIFGICLADDGGFGKIEETQQEVI